MSTNTTRIPLRVAAEAAKRIVEAFTPVCEKIMVAGSVRRQIPTIGDIEIVLLPSREKGVTDFFGNTGPGNITEEFIKVVNSFEKIRGQPNGRYIKLRTPVDWVDDGAEWRILLDIDIFMPQPHDWGRILAIRTGSADYSAKILAVAWRKKGWVGTIDGLRLEKECFGHAQNKSWECNTQNPTLPPLFNTEELFFQFLEIPYLEPSKRNMPI